MADEELLQRAERLRLQATELVLRNFDNFHTPFSIELTPENAVLFASFFGTMLLRIFNNTSYPAISQPFRPGGML